MKKFIPAAAVLAASLLIGGAALAATRPAPEPVYPFHDITYGPEWAPQPGGGVLLP